ncbi:hypothetical protein Agub_g5496 [Astrephomene gubernaculifera]|uniref:Transaldolase n=1 Tax=Astrephomene gubernaculifera TaxID=47775 RepID=A0AAD3HKP5_9CHLO|nr:hypothetical protein Agub_g5496 [Astrephomene gubernaculifera]
MLLSSKPRACSVARTSPATAINVRAPLRRGARCVTRAVQEVVIPPSSVTAANELQSLSRLSTVVPDTLALETLTPGARLAAATVSAATVRSVLLGESLGLKPYENAINAALAAPRSASLPPGLRGSPLAAASDPVDRAFANLGAMMCDVVWGRVETQVDPRLAEDEAAVASKVRALASLYGGLRVPLERLVFGLPATWAATQAAGRLEAEGIATDLYMVYSMVQGVAAMQAGASVIRLDVGRIRDWYDKNPGAIRNPHGPREDAGVPSSHDPALALVRDLYCYGRRFHPKTKIMAMGLRSRKDALDLAGLDYLVLSPRVLEQLSLEPTDQGYNDGLSAVSGGAGVQPALTPQLVAESDMQRWEPLTESSWRGGLGAAASQLLAASLAARRSDMTELEELLARKTQGSE